MRQEMARKDADSEQPETRTLQAALGPAWFTGRMGVNDRRAAGEAEVPHTDACQEIGLEVGADKRLYCGQKVGRGGYKDGPKRWCQQTCLCDGFCGPTNGCQCARCYDATYFTPVFALGDAVRVKTGLSTVINGWGKVTKQSVGTVSKLPIGSGKTMEVNFPEQEAWVCKEEELERSIDGSMIGKMLTSQIAKIGLRVKNIAQGQGTLLGWKVEGKRYGDTSGGLVSDGYARVAFDSMGSAWNVSMDGLKIIL